MTIKNLAWGGILAPLLFIFALSTFSFLTPNYSNLTNAVSELGTPDAPFALLWNLLGFGLVGLLTLALALGLYLDLNPGPGAKIISILVAISGIGFAGLGLFPAETGFQPSIRTSLHFLFVSINFLPFILAAFIFAFKLKVNDYWKSWSIFSICIGILALASFFIPQNIPVGLSQRLGMGANFLWLFIIGLALLKKASRKE